jgi:hypothetical protein
VESAPQKTAASRNWRFPLAIGLAIGLALPVAQAVGTNLEPSLGYWAAFALRVTVAGAVGGLVAGGISWLFRPSSKDRA